VLPLLPAPNPGYVVKWLGSMISNIDLSPPLSSRLRNLFSDLQNHSLGIAVVHAVPGGLGKAPRKSFDTLIRRREGRPEADPFCPAIAFTTTSRRWLFMLGTPTKTHRGYIRYHGIRRGSGPSCLYRFICKVVVSILFILHY
jgi:hypothetical protein